MSKRVSNKVGKRFKSFKCESISERKCMVQKTAGAFGNDYIKRKGLFK